MQNILMWIKDKPCKTGNAKNLSKYLHYTLSVQNHDKGSSEIIRTHLSLVDLEPRQDLEL